MAEQRTQPDESPKHPIQVVARRTGLSADVIRAWERRYGAVAPQRSETRRRLYSDADAERLLLLKRVTDSGRRIGDVAHLSLEELEALVEADREAVARAETATVARPARASAREHFDACLAAIRNLDPVGLDAALAHAAVSLNMAVLLEEVLAPLMRHVGDQWRNGPLRVAHEHFATAHLRSFLGSLVVQSNLSEAGPTLVAGTPLGQSHELGALMAGVVAASGGWNVLFLGPNVPVDEIVFTVVEKRAQAVALSLCYPADDSRLITELKKLGQLLPAGTRVVVGGAGHRGYQSALEEIGAVSLESLSELPPELDRLRLSAG
ncbi:MAG: MerR family transcriptional regulator [Gammaproteobacteria bacterium]|nr:MerR family transcriptional regulator [Gammaproteobacteria bacterium]NIR90057.1 MerR family transcriptional regulator [Gammaproteobacteria bacterium]NIU03261.1 MerR family transcriptional regulator [Gammaproteobacteria bacterium]NIV50755.1 MerR family transcriptional regulator [Gammaproteobacteria bacterium]NIV75341.1 MerR family transcriptional regulator [Gammaproteobacteria bacterium]